MFPSVLFESVEIISYIVRATDRNTIDSISDGMYHSIINSLIYKRRAIPYFYSQIDRLLQNYKLKVFHGTLQYLLTSTANKFIL